MKKVLPILLLLNYVNAVGQFEWARKTGIEGDLKSIVAADNGDFFILVSDSVSKIYRLDSNINIVDSYFFPGNIEMHALQINSSNDQIVLVGSIWHTVSFSGMTFVSKGYSDGFVGAVDTQFNWLWTHFYGSKGYDGCTAVAINSKDEIFIGGRFEDTVTIGPQICAAPGWYEMFFAKLNKAGDFLAIIVDNSPKDSATSKTVSGIDRIHINQLDEVLVTGYVGGRKFFALNAYTLTPSLGGFEFMYRFDSQLTPFWGRLRPYVYRYLVWERRAYGFTTQNVIEAFSEGSMGCSRSDVIVCDKLGDTLATHEAYGYTGPINIQNTNSYILGIINDDAIIGSSIYYHTIDEPGKEMHICRVRSSGYDYIASVDGAFSRATITKTSESSIYLSGIFYDTLHVGEHHLVQDSGKKSQVISSKFSIDFRKVGLLENKNSTFRFDIFPNPSTNDVYIYTNLNYGKEFRINLVDERGKLVLSKSAIENGDYTAVSLDNNISPGIYFLNIEIDGQNLTKKIIKE